ncbi:MAG: M6 family metalloprotease domain-containing protein [Prevotella sp.]|nr:M6 family metalloprotease domain-containing protein [Prevotella sp.]MBQ6033386.1 M6 family metalloprotease domain-containing protein [Prevotella sp.]MBQ6658901.1 M6 family metalloprotease domain-containing protein [Prevotella sp.]MBQ7716405.1 M6 family metalloprotease domain-containing protein [Prevotella sp.]MBQ9571459.1 M6 family metalloprotease domain-containing protein [Prevotella sp.]
MKKRLLLSVLASLMAVLTVSAVPAKPGVKIIVTLNNGKTVELALRGDEHFSFYTDHNGVPFRQIAEDKYEQLTNRQVDSLWALCKQVRMEKGLNVNSSMRKAPKRKAGIPSTVTTGKQRGLVILMQFQDVKFSTEEPKAAFQRFFNEKGYSDDGNAGSVKDYFLRQSYEQLEIDFDVVGPFTTKYNMEYYGAPVKDDNDKIVENDVNPVGMISEAVDAASAEVDFSKYDWNNDGEVDQVFVVYAGYNQAQGADANTIWPHEWSLAAGGLTKTYNGKIINTYGCSSELQGNGKSYTGHMDGIGTACHEFSHCLGLPDMYDTSSSGSNFGMGPWDVMDNGSYNDNSHTPAGYTSYERMFAGWLTPTEIKTMTRINGMKPLATNPEAYILYNEANRNEYYLLENRQKVGFDRGLYGHGLLILHVDYSQDAWISNTVNNMSGHQRMTPIPADNQLSFYTNSLASDPWPGQSGNTALTNFTTPAATLYNNNSDGTKFMSKNIDNITENTSDNTVSFVACRPDLGVPSPDGGTEVSGTKAFTVTWPAVSGAVAYQLELTEIGSAPTDPTQALVREFNFEKWETKTVGYSDIAANNKMPDYGLSGWSGSKLYTTPNKLRFGTSSATGWLRTPTWSVPPSTDFTLVIGADVFKEGTSVTGTIDLAYGNSGDAPTYETTNFEVTGNGKQVFSFNVKKDLFYLTISPNAQMYLNYFAIYDGVWSAEQLGITSSGAKASFAPRYASEVTTYTTDTNSYTFNNLNKSNRYVYRVRSIGDENTYSQWSEDKTFAFETSGIQNVQSENHELTISKIYDLHGRYMGTELNALPKGVYIIGGKKIIK